MTDDVPKPNPGLFRRKWQDPAPPSAPTAPPPTVLARLATDEELTSRSIKGLLNALGEGWIWRARFARGYEVVKRRKDGSMVSTVVDAETVMIRLQNTDGVRAIALFVNGSYREGWTWLQCLEPLCQNAGFEHPMNTPVPIGFRDLCVIVTDECALPLPD